MTHQALANEIARELLEDENVFALILYGSVARHEECANSDVDLMVLTNKVRLQKRHEVRHGITVEYLDTHVKFLRKAIAEYEAPILFLLAEGIVLFDRIPETGQLIAKAKEMIAAGPPVNPKWENERYATKRRADLTEMYEDLLDVDDEIAFHYIVSLLIASAIPMLNENYGLWPRTRKKTTGYLKSQCHEGYQHIETLLNPRCSLPEKRGAAKDLIDCALKRHGGVLKGDAIIFRIDTL